ncbi:branched-chain amino acid ABC transporter ATP-binding protein/permease [Streptomyces poriferorum]|uniref:branched-chain amino acid ABC transporter ATP-binding protein/permease n=1 Tax=Streptomyces TaxID=1883 RepID=UPI001C5CC56C|nr:MULTISPECIES: branched-chain amino acid ABC transporter ATP-binding protein/permease [Streptomyces]MBW5248375.1 branched-chain amino acid ABC transporter ATP-binding protein/permease [Streptomyces poriferorum]MBW5255657.1 branched-chain amino acid ABC transporter ATP-binding protein/permease [Streptomyces poriferorum]WLQ52019.1 branched-chain amino acid ABC transporter ATP-binding protein/permease [Streptomyces sp. Alt1]WSI66887.1 branched-chain amino acid ABC transporter ATP-binding protein
MSILTSKPALILLGCVAAYLLPYGLNSYSMHVVDIAIIFALLAIGMGLVMGVAGQINLAQVAFFGVGAYTTAILTTHSGFGFWTAAIVGLAATVLVGLLVGLPALRMQSHYLGIVTLGLALGFVNWITNAEITGGADGISGIPVPPFFGIDLADEYLYYYLEIVVFGLALAFGTFVVRTRLGRRLRAMRDDALAAGAMGAEIPLLRMTAFMLASVYGGAAGILYAGLIRYVAPETFSLGNMFLLLAMVIIGGRRSLIGCVVGAVGLVLIREALVDFAVYAQLGYGIVVVLMVVFAPTGLAGIPRRVREAVGRRRKNDDVRSAELGPYLPGPAPAAQVPESGADSGPALEISHLTKRFGALTALDDVTLTVRQGEIRGIVGPNGSGKTTLFNVISGLYRPSAGQVSGVGRDISRARPYQLSLAGMARTFQNLRLFSQMTVRENILVVLDRSRTSTVWQYAVWPVGVLSNEHRLQAEADRVLKEYGLTAFADAHPQSLPYGIQRRIEIARAMAGRPSLLLLDEPAAGLNGEEVGQLSSIVRSIRDQGVTVVLIEHNMGLVMSLCERITVLAAGSVIAEGSPAEVAATPEVIEAYLGDSAPADIPVHAAPEVP